MLKATFLSLLLLLGVVDVLPAHASGLSLLPADQCDISGSPLSTNKCVGGANYAGVGPALTAGAYTDQKDAARLIAGQSALTAIDAHGKARYLDNKTNNNLFVPFKLAQEWDAVLGSSANFLVVDAAVPDPTPRTIVPGANCGSPALLPPTTPPLPMPPTVTIPYYARPQTTITGPTLSFDCTVKGLCGNGMPSCGLDQHWTQTAAVTYSSGTPDSHDVVPWAVNVVYTGTAPPANHEPVDGVCGVGQYSCSQVCDRESSCKAGVASAQSSNGNTFYWHCSGMNGGALSGQCSDTNGSCGSNQFQCATGTLSAANDSNGTSTWSCLGVNGGTNDSCNICDSGYVRLNGVCVLPVNGQCGVGNYSCRAGSVINASSDGNNDYWYCQGTNGGTNSGQCLFALPKTGQCGGNVWACNIGTAFNGSSDWNNDYWTCSGLNGGANSPQCSFPIAHNGQCSSSDWTCSIGTATNGWSNANNDYWTCSGVNGGSSSGQCSFARPVNGQCSGSQWQCVAGNPAGGNDSNGTSTWYCGGLNGGANSGTCTSCDTGYTWNAGQCRLEVVQCNLTVTSYHVGTVPNGIWGNISYTLIGGGGGGGKWQSTGSNGATVSSSFAANAGDTLTIIVGGGGGGGSPYGGGGGSGWYGGGSGSVCTGAGGGSTAILDNGNLVQYAAGGQGGSNPSPWYGGGGGSNVGGDRPLVGGKPFANAGGLGYGGSDVAGDGGSGGAGGKGDVSVKVQELSVTEYHGGGGGGYGGGGGGAACTSCAGKWGGAGGSNGGNGSNGYLGAGGIGGSNGAGGGPMSGGNGGSAYLTYYAPQCSM